MAFRLDLEKFWHDNDLAAQDPFGKEIPQPPFHHWMGYETIFDELGIEEDLWRFQVDFEYARDCAKRYNDLAEKIVGRRLLDENACDPSRRFPAIKSIGEIFGCKRVWQANSWWLLESVHTTEELSRLLDRVEKLDLRSAMIPDNWEHECRWIHNHHGLKPTFWHGQRGPVTLATSIFGVENLLFLILDDPPLAARFRDLIAKVMINYYHILDSLVDPSSVPKAFCFYDDNCAMLTPEMYAFFGQPILQAVFRQFAPGPEDYRYQHSDSDMGHLLPLLAQTGLKRVNFGPNIRFAQIRAAMPHAVIEGTLPPYVYMRNDEPAIIAAVRRDLDEARQCRGLVVATAGSVNNGTRLTSMRTVMATIQQFGRYPAPGN